MCDAAGNCVVVCSIENIDPLGVHTGDSWTVAPQQTLSDQDYQRLREAAIACARAVGVATGGANVQFAYEPETRDLAADRDEPPRLALLGARLQSDGLSDREACRAARRRLHARRAPERHHGQDDGCIRARARLRRGQGSPLRLGEVPAGFEDARLRDAIGRRVARPRANLPRGLSQGARGPGRGRRPPRVSGRALLLPGGARVDPRGRTAALGRRRRARREAFRAPRLPHRPRPEPPGGRGAQAPATARPARRRLLRGRVRGADAVLLPLVRDAGRRGRVPSGRSVVVLGSGPNRIGQGIEFDYCCVRAAEAFRKLGYEAVLINSNPETVSTDYDTSDRLYLEPLTLERVLDVYELERPVGVVVSLGGQTPLALAGHLAEAGVPLLGDPLRGNRGRRGPGLLRPHRRGPRSARAALGNRHDGARGSHRRRADRLPGARSPSLRARRARHADRAVPGRALALGPLARGRVPRGRTRARRRLPLRRRSAPGSRASSSTWSRQASTPATPHASRRRPRSLRSSKTRSGSSLPPSPGGSARAVC